MLRALARYAHWLHGQWPAGTVENLPELDADGQTNVRGLYVVGDLAGVPLLKFAADSGTRAVRHLAGELRRAAAAGDSPGLVDVAVIGAGVAGMAAALEARQLGLSCTVIESGQPFATIADFPRGKPIYTYPTQMEPAGQLRLTADVKEDLLRELTEQTVGTGLEPRAGRARKVIRRGDHFEVELADQEPLRARRVVVAMGRSGHFRRLGVPGEGRDTVHHRLGDPAAYGDRDVLVVGGGDSALETAIAVAEAGGRVTLSYRQPEFVRPKAANVQRLQALQTGAKAAAGAGSLALLMGSQVEAIGADTVQLRDAEGQLLERPCDATFTMIGRQPPLDFFRASGVALQGEWRPRRWVSLVLILLAATVVYHWKSDLGFPVKQWFEQAGWFPFNLARPDSAAGLWNILRLSATQPGFHYSLVYSLAVVGFGWRRIRRQDTPYVRLQTVTLAAIQCLPLFLLPFVLLPWAGHCGWFDSGAALQPVADALFPESQWAVHGREYWRSLGLILAWPLFIWNVFSHQPMGAWLAISLVQTFVVIPALVYYWGKGAYCGWICSCGALAETLGDSQRRKMPHGPGWNRLNLAGQVVLLLVAALLVLRLISWGWPGATWIRGAYMGLFMGRDLSWSALPFPLTFLNYAWAVDLLLSGIVGVGLYWHFSGRVWCRFVCPLAALMHIYARFSRFRILASKARCISCNVCTAVCHQGIDVMSFASRGAPMADPECVRCSACVASCPTGVLQFGQVDPTTGRPLAVDRLAASQVRQIEQP